MQRTPLNHFADVYIYIYIYLLTHSRYHCSLQFQLLWLWFSFRSLRLVSTFERFSQNACLDSFFYLFSSYAVFHFCSILSKLVHWLVSIFEKWMTGEEGQEKWSAKFPKLCISYFDPIICWLHYMHLLPCHPICINWRAYIWRKNPTILKVTFHTHLFMRFISIVTLCKKIELCSL